ncbi:hypothetical protein HWV00_04400 [Moritella sp. 24]|uniref:hypothetical protein n=1 Tax=Moritella sp. 24 TaxID=2746230 RepID=UPI001BA77F87|nr:hypothetical protein [Moritella sp. 24]QUM75535.1 hypothetical protein HWV00_04400 [Moritella sp. 24]
MKYWYGFRCVELDGTNPGHKCLEGPFTSYNEAKEHKKNMRARDMQHTPVFKAYSKLDAEGIMLAESFSRL